MGRKNTAVALLRRTHPQRSSKPQLPPQPRSKPHLLTLPGEIRNKIYDHLLDSSLNNYQHQPEAALTTDACLPHTTHPLPRQPPIAYTSRQLRHETLSLLYSSKTYTIAPTLGTQNLITTWSKIRRPSLWYLRSITFTLNTEFSAADDCTQLENALCDRVLVHAWLEPCTSTKIAFDIPRSNGTCGCKFARCARDVERGVLGSAVDAPLIRFLRAWDLPPPPVRSDRYLVCAGCGGGNVQVSLRDIRRVGRRR